MSRPTPTSGRRIYVHQDSLAHVAQANLTLASQVTFALHATTVLKSINHHVSDQGVQLGLVRSSYARSLQDSARRAWGDPMTRLLRGLVYRPADPSRWGEVDLVLGLAESVVATCSDSGYLTFATDEAAADRMFADHQPLRELATSVNSGSGPADLTMVRGRNLAPHSIEIGIGMVATSYFPVSLHLIPDEVVSIRRRTGHTVLADLERLISTLGPTSGDESRVLSNLLQSMRGLTQSQPRIIATPACETECG